MFTILFALGILGTLTTLSLLLSEPVVLIQVIPVVLEVIAVYYLFTSSSRAWLRTGDPTNHVPHGSTNIYAQKRSNVWNKVIPRFNWITLCISLAILLLIDLPILRSSPDLAGFFYIMLATLACFLVLFGLENYVFRKSMLNTFSSALDGWIVALISARNVVVILSVIPFIQLIGMAAIVFGGIPWIIAYVILIFVRYRKSKPKVVTT